MSDDARVSQTVWPWRRAAAADPAATQADAARLRARAAIEAIVMLAVAATLHFGFHKVWAPRVVTGMAVLVLAGGLAYPPLYHGMKRGALALGSASATAMTWLVLVPFFYLCFTVGRLCFRLAGKDPLQRGYDVKAATYWVKRPVRHGVESYRRQY